MKINYLLPTKFKIIGFSFLIIGVLLFIYGLIIDENPDFLNTSVFAIIDWPILSSSKYLSMVTTNIIDELIGVLIIVGCFLIAFSKEAIEDEFIHNLRLKSLLLATYINYGIILFSIIFFYNMAFFWMLMLNTFTVLIIFIIHFKISVYKLMKQENEK